MTTQNPFGSDDEGGAFAFSEDVDWESTGFADEERIIPSAPTPQVPAATPQPVAPQQPAAPRAVPAQPTPTPGRHAAQPSQHQPTPGIPQQPRHNQPSGGLSPQQPPVAHRPAPVPPAATGGYPSPPVQPQAPLPSAATPYQPAATQAEAAAQHPVQPAAPQVAPQPAAPHVPTAVPTPVVAPQQRALPHPTAEDLTTPDWAAITPTPTSDDADEPAFSGEAFEDPFYPSSPAVPHPQDTSRRSRGKRAAPKPRPAKRQKSEPTAREGKSRQYAGGRWKIKVFRALVFGVLGILMLGGLKNVIVNGSQPTPEELADTVKAELGVTGFPTEAAEDFAVRFTREYLTFNQDTVEQRQTRLATYSPSAVSGEWGWDGTGAQDVITGPYIGADTKVDGKHFATVTVTAQISTGEWVALAVPVYADDNAALTIAGAPAYIALPSQATSPGKERDFDQDDEVASVLAEQVLPGFFVAWAASDATALSRYLTPDASEAARTGLRSTVTFGSVDNVSVPAGGRTRDAYVTVTWMTPTAGSFTQEYRLAVVETDDVGWSVKDIGGGVVAPASGPATTETP